MMEILFGNIKSELKCTERQRWILKHAEWKKPDTNEQTLCDFIYMKLKNKQKLSMDRVIKIIAYQR